MQGLLSVARAAVVVLWLCLLFIQYRSGGTPNLLTGAEAGLTSDVPKANANDRWMGVYISGRKVGYTHQRLTPENGGFRFTEESLLRIKVLDSDQTVRSEVKGTVAGDWSLRSFSVSLRSGVGVLEATGEVADGHLDVSLLTAGERTQQRLPTDGPLYVAAVARERLVQAGLAPGRELTVSVFDPSSMQNHPLHMTVAAAPAAADASVRWRVREQFRNLETTVWLDGDGHVVREEGPMGFTAVRESAEQALTAGWDGNNHFDLIAAVAIPIDPPIPDARNLARFEARVAGLGDMVLPSDARQRLYGNKLIVERETATGGASYVLPYGGSEWRAELAATPFLQSDHPRVRETAAEILQGEVDARRAAERLRHWVFEHLRKVPTASLPNALQALAMGEGDCNEHAVLYAALARAAGLPARVVAGIVYIDGVFLYHAWNEVWLGEGWVSTDTTVDQMPVDATHVKLVEGGPEAHTAIVPLLGRLSIEVLNAG
jgi:hypothetical protein